MRILICVPTYNEAENITPFITAVFENAPPETDMLVIDDNSPDGTAALVEALASCYGARLFIIKRPGKLGGASAFLRAFAWGLDHGYDGMLAMDADFSHDPGHIPAILAKQAEGADVVIGSRFVKGGKIENRSWKRNVISQGASWYCRLLLGCPIKDWTGGYNLWTRAALEKITLQDVVTRGYSFQIELKYKAFLRKCLVVETPILFKDRKLGASKMSGRFLFQALVDVWRIKYMCIPHRWLKELMKFCVTGGLGTISNLSLFFLCADLLGLPVVPVSTGCFIIAGSQNYIIDHKWSFARAMGGTGLSVKRWLLFLSASLLGFAVNITVMTALVRGFPLPFKVIAQAGGIASGMVINFLASKYIVFRRKNHDGQHA